MANAARIESTSEPAITANASTKELSVGEPPPKMIARNDLAADRAAERPHHRVDAGRHPGLLGGTASTIRLASEAKARPMPAPSRAAAT